MKNIINHEVLEKEDIKIEHEKMANGEIRFRIKTTDVSTISFCKIENKARWQNAHYHKHTKELYVVQTGKVVIAVEEKDKNVKYHILNIGDTFMVEPRIKHNVYLLPGASTCVIKFGKNTDKDWFPAVDLDLICENYKTQVS